MTADGLGGTIEAGICGPIDVAISKRATSVTVNCLEGSTEAGICVPVGVSISKRRTCVTVDGLESILTSVICCIRQGVNINDASRSQMLHNPPLSDDEVSHEAALLRLMLLITDGMLT